LQDRPALNGTEITKPEQGFDQVTNQPNVTFSFTGNGQSAFQDVTRTISQRGSATAPPGTVSSGAADNYSQHFAIVLDNQVFSNPIINFVDNPDGIDGRNGAQISGNFTISSAQDLAKILQAGALPVKLVLTSQSTVSATLGKQALDQGLKAGIIGLAVIVLFTHAVLGTVGRSKAFQSPRALGTGKQRVRWHFDFSGASRWFFSMSGTILAIGAISLATNQLNLGIDFTSGAKVTASLQRPASVDQVRTALENANVDNAASAEIQTVSNPQLGPNVIEI